MDTLTSQRTQHLDALYADLAREESRSQLNNISHRSQEFNRFRLQLFWSATVACNSRVTRAERLQCWQQQQQPWLPCHGKGSRRRSRQIEAAEAGQVLPYAPRHTRAHNGQDTQCPDVRSPISIPNFPHLNTLNPYTTCVVWRVCEAICRPR